MRLFCAIYTDIACRPQNAACHVPAHQEKICTPMSVEKSRLPLVDTYIITPSSEEPQLLSWPPLPLPLPPPLPPPAAELAARLRAGAWSHGAPRSIPGAASCPSHHLRHSP